MTDKSKAGGLSKVLGSLAVVGVLGLALWVLYGELRHFKFHDIARSVGAYAPATVALAALFAALNYLSLTLFDTLGLGYAGGKLAWPKVAFTSFLSYVFSTNVGLSIFGSSAVRYRFYSAWGLSPSQIAKIVGFCVLGFWVGLFSLGGLSFIVAPPPPAQGLPAFLGWGRPLGFLLLALVAAYLLLSFLRPPLPRIRGVELSLPAPGLVLGQIVAGCLDWLLAGAVLYVLLPLQDLNPFHFLAIYMLAQLAGVTSHVPGGLGVFETIIVLSLSGLVGADRLLGALVVYRLVYYLFPLVLAFLGFLLAELLRERGRLSAGAQTVARLVLPALPSLLAALTFLGGVVLLFSTATPAGPGRLDLLGAFLPLGVVEVSHFGASLAGLGLLILAEALNRRINAAWFLSSALLGLGALLVLLKGFRYEEAIVLLVLLALLLPMRGLFHRRAAILDGRPGFGWTLALLVVLVCSGWLGFFTWKHVEYSNDLWWQFELKAGAPRFLRAALGISLLGLIVFGRRLLAPLPHARGDLLGKREAEVRACVAANASASANLALLGDKYFRFSEDGRAFLMYGYSGRSAVVMSDPVGDPASFQDLVWAFFEEESREGRRVVFYEVSSRHLPLYLELGMTLMKTGEEARLPLGDFGLEGGRRAKLRTPLNKMRREGYAFRVLEGADRDAALPEFARITRAWLDGKKGREKGFSLGRFSEPYLRNFPCAVIEKDGAMLAFANIWTTGVKEEFAIDLMRHEPGAPNGIMEFLFTNLALWGKEEGYRHFSLGIAPMSGIRESGAVPIWNRAVSLIYHAGGRLYNFEGLRRYKEKYDPEWSPVYLVSRGRFSVPVIAAEIASLVAKAEVLS